MTFGFLVLDEDYLNKRIVIENVTHYAYGQHDDGEIGVWVAGRAGWFSISPAKGYKNMFNETVEAIDLLYFLADRHQRKRRRQKAWNPSVEYLLEEVGVLVPIFGFDLMSSVVCDPYAWDMRGWRGFSGGII